MNAINEITAGVADATRQIQRNGGDIDRVISLVKTGVASLGIGLGFKELVSQVADTRDEFQKLEIAFKTFLGSEQEASKLMQQMVHTAAITPFDLAGVADGAKNLLAFGVAAEDVNKTIISLGDIAAGLSQPLGDIIYLYGTTISKPKMDTQDLMQFMSRGIPLAKALAEQFGVTENKVRSLVSAGKVGRDEVIKAIDSLTAEGSMFGGLMEAQSKSIGGQIANIKDAVAEMFNEIGKASEGVMNTTLETTSKIVENWRTVLEILGSVAAAYSVQKGLLMFSAGFQQATSNVAYDAEIAQLQSLIPTKEQEARTALEQAVASGRLSESKAALVMSLREEAEEYVRTLAAREAAANQDVLSTQAALTNAMQEKEIADEFVKDCEAKSDALFDLGDTIGFEAAQEELEIALAIQAEAADALATAGKEARQAASAHVTAQQELENATTAIGTAQAASNAQAVGILTLAKEKLAAASAKVNAVVSSNAFMIVTAALIAMGKAMYDLCTSTSELTKAEMKAKEISICTTSAMHSELNALESLEERMRKAKKGSEDWKSAKNDLLSQFGKYSSTLDTEIEQTSSLADTYARLTKAVRAYNAAKAIQKYETDHDISGDIDNTLAMIQTRLGGKFNKVDGAGNMVKDGMNPVKTYLNKALQEHILLELNKYVNDSSYQLTPQTKGYLDQIYNSEMIGIGPAATSVKLTPYHELMRGQVKAHEAGKNLIYSRHSTSKEEVDEVLGIKPQKENSGVNDKAYWEEKKKEAVGRLEALDDIAAAGKKGAAIRKEIEGYDRKLELYSISKRKTSGPTSAQLLAKEENAAGKLADVMRRQAQERLRMEQDYELERWQTRIGLMQEGEAKVLAQEELDFKKEKNALQRRKEQELEAERQRQMEVFNAQEDVKAAANKKYAKKTFNRGDIDLAKGITQLLEIEKELEALNGEKATLNVEVDATAIADIENRISGLEDRKADITLSFGDVDIVELKAIAGRFDSLEADLTATQKKAEADRLDAARESMNAYLKEFGDYQQKRLAIQEEYETKISEAQNDGERMMLIGQRNKALSDLDYSEWVDTGSIALAFGDISRLSDKTVERLIADMEKYREKVIATFDPDKIQKYEEALGALRKTQSDKSFGFISSFVPDYFKERKSTGGQLDSAGKNVNRLYEERAAIYNRILDLKKRIADAEAKGEDTADLNAQLREQEVAFYANSNAAKKAVDAFRQLQEQWDRLETPQEKFKALCAAVSAVTDVVGPLASQAAEMCDALGGNGLAAALSSLSEALDSIGSIANGFTNGGLVGGIAAAAGEVMKWTTKLFRAGDNRKQKHIERLQEQIDALNRSYEKLSSLAEEAFSTDASELIEQQDQLLRQQQALLRQQMAEEEAKKKTDKEKLKHYQEQIEEIDETLAENSTKAKEAIIGEDLKSAINEFASLYAEAWNDGTDAAQKSMAAVRNIISSALSELLKKDIQPAATRFYDALAEAMKDGVLTEAELVNLDAIKKEMDDLAAKSQEQWEMIQNRYRDLEELKEDLTDISFDSVRDNFKSLLSDMESTTADFTDSFSDMLRNALIDGLMDTKYDNMLKEWYDEFAEAMNDRTLTDTERDKLRQQYDAIVQQGIADRDFINEIVGGGAYSQEATKGGWASMGQDTADELNGRFTALTELSATGNSLAAEGNMLSAQILATLRDMSALSMTTSADGESPLRDIRDMMFLSTGHLEDIAKYSRQLSFIREGIDNMRDLIDRRL